MKLIGARLSHEATRSDTKLQVHNLGIGGDSSTKILKRMPQEIESRYSASWQFVFIFSFGTNDQRTTDGKPETTLEQFTINATAIIREARIHTNKILFVGTPPIGLPTATLKGKEYSDERVRHYETQLSAILDAECVPFVPIRPAFEWAPSDTLYAFDQLHPNDAGHALIAAAVLPELDKLIGYDSVS